MDINALVNLLFSGGTALAGLILVFLGGVLNAYESFDPASREFAKQKYRFRIKASLFGFLSAVLSALSALAYYWFSRPYIIQVSLFAMLVSFGLLMLIAILAVKEV